MKYNIIFDSRLWATLAQFWWCGGTTVGGEVENTGKNSVFREFAHTYFVSPGTPSAGEGEGALSKKKESPFVLQIV